MLFRSDETPEEDYFKYNLDEEIDKDYENKHSEDKKTENMSNENMGDDKVDLGSDEDYIYVDHSHDDERVLDEDDEVKFDFRSDDVQYETEFDVNEKPQSQKHHHRRGINLRSRISDVVNGESHFEQEEVETVRGEIIDEDDYQYKPAPSDDSVVEAEIVYDDEELNIFNDNLSSDNLEKPTPKHVYDDDEWNIFNDDLSDETLERPTPKDDYVDEPEVILEKPNHRMDYTEGEELNIFTDELSDLNKDEINKKATDIVGRAMEEIGRAHV